MRRRRILIILLVIACIVTAADLVERRFSSPSLHYYQSVDLKKLGSFNFDQAMGTINDVPRELRRLDGRKVSVQGFMYSPTSAPRVSEFQLVYNIQEHHRPPLLQERVFARVATGKMVPLSAYVELKGTLHVDVKRPDDFIESVYTMDVDGVQVVGSPGYVYASPTLVPTRYESLLLYLQSKDLTLLDLPTVALWIVIAVIATRIELQSILRRRRRAAGRCPNCGYDLRACAERCPECGSTEGFADLPPWFHAGNRG